MSVVLKLQSGSTAGRKLRLQPNQVVQVGRTEWADFAVNEDPHMAPVHFRLAADNQNCHLLDLGSDRGTLVNGRPVTACVLTSGDLITAGSTQFEVLIERFDRLPGSAPKEARSVKSPAVLPPGFRYEPVLLGPGVEVLRGSAGGRAPLELVRLIGNRYSPQMLVDFARAGVPAPAEVENWPDLLARLPEPLRGGRSLRIVRFDSDTSRLLGQVWGKDSLICLFGKEGSGPERAVWDSLGAFTRPLFLRQQLLRPGRLPTLLSSIPAVLLETDDHGWELYRNPALIERWDELGLTTA